MSDQYDNTNRGAIWPNLRKEKDTHPDFTGEINVEGRAYWFSAWKRKPDAGPKAPSLTFRIKPKDAELAAPTQSVADDMNDEIPF